MQTIITVLDSITETSMPFNEFVIYRGNHYKDQKQYLVVCGKEKGLPQITIPDNVEIVYTGTNLKRIRKVLTGLIDKCKRNNTEYVVHMHHVQSGLLAELAMLGTHFRKKVLFTVHNTFSGYSFHNKVLSFINALFAQRITCVSYAAYNSYPKFVKLIKGSRIVGVQNGVDTERIDGILEKTNMEENNDNIVTFIYVARMVPVKNHDFLVEVIKRTDPASRFIFVGAEDPEKNIRKKVIEYGIEDRVEFTGLIPRNEVFSKLRNAEVYISPSKVEGLPISLLEGMYCGLATIISDIGPHKEVACDEEYVSVLPLDLARWVDAVNGFIRKTKEERIELGKKSREYVYNTFSLDRMHKNYDSIYKKMMQ